MALPMDWDIPKSIRGRFGERLGRQRAMAGDGHLVLVLHKVPEGKDPARTPVAYWRDPAGQWRCSTGGEGLARLIAHVAEYEKRVDLLESVHQRASDAEGWFGVLGQVAPLHRAAANMLAAFQSAREAIGDDRDLITLRDRVADIDRAIELLHHDVKHALDYAVARQAEEQAQLTYRLARSGHRLTVLASLFLPLTALGAAFGMNLRSGIEGLDEIAFWGVLLLAMGLGLMLYLMLIVPEQSRGRPGGGVGEPPRAKPKHDRRARRPKL